MGNKQIAAQPALEEAEGKVEASEKVKPTGIYLDFQRLTIFPAQVFHEPYSLTTLSLNFNHLAKVPESISQLTSLTELSLEGNHLTSLPESLCCLISLKFLALGANNLQTLPSGISRLSSLQELRASGNLSLSLTSLPSSTFSPLTHLTVLSLGHISLSFDAPSHSQSCYPPLPHSLLALHLPHNHLTCVLPTTVVASLTELDLSENHLTSIPSALLSLTRLSRLYLGCNDIASLPLDTNLVSRSWPVLRHLQLAYNSLPSLPSADFLSALSSLELLELTCNAFNFLPQSSNASLPKFVVEMPAELPDKICDRVFLGDLHCARNKHALLHLGVRHVLTVATFRPFYPHVFEYKVVDVEDQDGEDLLCHFEACVEFIDRGVEKGGVFVHCRAGVSRSATVMIAYVMKKFKLSFKEAMDYVQERRPRICPKGGFRKQLDAWGELLGKSMQ